MSRLPKGIRQLEKPLANETTEPLSFTASRESSVTHVSGAQVLGRRPTIMEKTKGKVMFNKIKSNREAIAEA